MNKMRGVPYYKVRNGRTLPTPVAHVTNMVVGSHTDILI